MVKRICAKCNLEFDRKFCYDRHINKKHDCSLKSNQLNDLNNKKTEDLIFAKICKNFQKFANMKK